MPERFLLQILRSLVTHGVLKSTRGVDGGYSLLRDPKEVTVLEIIEAIEGPIDTGFAGTGGWSDESHKRLKDALGQIAHTTKRQLESITLSSLISTATDK